MALLWSGESQAAGDGAKYLLFYVLPLGLVAVSLARLPWRVGWASTLYVQAAAMALVFALIGIWQYLTRNIYWNPKVEVDNAYAPVSWFYRVNSVFYDPSIYGRFLVVAILGGLALVLFERSAAWAALAVAAVTFIGLVPSFSQSSFVALAAGIVARPRRPLAAAGDRAARRGGRRPGRREPRRAPDPTPDPRQVGTLAGERRPLEARLERRPASFRTTR